MSEKNKNGNDRLSDFLRYKENKMTDMERNSFERNLQKDAFAGEASEGFEGIDQSLAEGDVVILRKQLKNRTIRKQRILWYRIASSVALLMIISSIIIFISKKSPSEQLSYTPATGQSKDQQTLKDQPASETNVPEAVSVEKKLPSATGPERSIKSPANTIENKNKSDEKLEKNREEVSVVNKELLEVPVVAQPDQVFAAEKAIPAKPGMAKKSSVSLSTINGRIISSEDKQPIPGVNVTVKGTSIGTVTDVDGNFNLNSVDAANRVLVANFVGMESKEFKAVGDSSLEIMLEPSEMALSEVVVVGYGVKSAGNEEEAVPQYTPPLPMNGRTAFNRYIQENIRRPDTTTTGQRVVVVLNFKVTENGKIDSISVIRSPGNIFSNEAIRLIREGPSWKPAEENGNTINDEVRIRIVFK
jgi:TonB family protein